MDKRKVGKPRKNQNVKNVRISDLCKRILEKKISGKRLSKDLQRQCAEYYKYEQKFNYMKIADVMGLHFNTVYKFIKEANLELQKTLEDTDTYDRIKIAGELTVKKYLVEEQLWKQEEYFNYYKVSSQWLKDLQNLGVIHEKPQTLNVNTKEERLFRAYEKLEVADLETLLELLQEIDAETENKKLN